MSFIQALSDGIMMGAIYGLMALGLSLVFGVMKIINFAHGAFIMTGMYVTYVFCNLFHAAPYVVFPLCIAVMFALGYLIQSGLINRILNAPSHNQLLLTLGIMVFLQNLVLFIFSADNRTITVQGFNKAFSFLGISVNKANFVALLVSLAAFFLVYVVMSKTILGKEIRATAQDRVGALLSGIKIKRVNAVAFGLAAACAGLAGLLITPSYIITPSAGDTFLFKCFVVAILGTLGNIWGALAAGIIVGVLESMSNLYIGGSWSEMVIYGIFVLTLLVRPTGLFGRREQRA